MDPLSKVLRKGSDGALFFFCQGCNSPHIVMHGPGSGPRWGWNGDVEKPTFTPSVLLQWDTCSPAVREQRQLFREQHGRYPSFLEIPADVHHVCHSYVTDGRIQYLGDCTHALANQTVDLPAWPDEWN